MCKNPPFWRILSIIPPLWGIFGACFFPTTSKRRDFFWGETQQTQNPSYRRFLEVFFFKMIGPSHNSSFVFFENPVTIRDMYGTCRIHLGRSARSRAPLATPSMPVVKTNTTYGSLQQNKNIHDSPCTFHSVLLVYSS